MTLKCDVLVVGAGCSGSVCALKLAKEGYSIVVVERGSCVGEYTKPKIDITEDTCLEDIIKELKLPVLSKTNRSKWFSRNHSFSLESDVFDIYFKRGPSRDSLAVNLINSAVDTGARLFLNAIPKKLNFKNGVVDSVELDINDKKEVLKPKVIVGADGFDSQVAKMAGLSIDRKIVTFVGYGVLSEGFDMPEGVTYILFDSEYAPGGYFYISKTPAGEGVACTVLDDSMISGTPEYYYKKFVRKNKTLTSILSKSKCRNTFAGRSMAGVMRTRVSRNILLMGDAAGLLDPLFGYGVRNAIISGYVGATTIEKMLDEGSLRVLREYDKGLEPIISEIKKSAETRSMLNGFTNKELNEIIKTRKIISYIDELYV